ncbi:MAG TPA: crossover junction endodeoxyribonuclease RuvC, partial [Ignavibacteriaceae bacterium]
RRISHGVIKLPSSKSLPEKLEIIYNELDKLLKLYKPDEFVIETAFYGKNVQSVLKIGYARGVSILAAIHNKVPTNEYSPREVKKAVVGKGAASKQQVNYMVMTILSSKKIKFKPDESDALAIALCHAFRLKTPSYKKSKSWKEFIESNPGRVLNS